MTSVDICNAALTRLGAAPITSLDDGTALANTCKTNWPTVRDKVLRSGDWPGCSKRASLSLLASTPIFGYSYQYQLPSDYLKLLSVDDEDYAHKVEGKMLLSDASSVSIEYVARVDEGYFDPGLQEALIVAMMDVLAYPATKSATFSEKVAGKAEYVLQEAKGKTTMEQDQTDDDSQYSFLTSRL